jgi:hypothetical protein
VHELTEFGRRALYAHRCWSWMPRARASVLAFIAYSGKLSDVLASSSASAPRNSVA